MYHQLKELREDKKLTQTQMGEILGCSQRAYCSYELGHRNIPTEVWMKLADFYGVSVDYLMGRTNQKK